MSFDLVFWEIVLASTMRLATPIALAALGEAIVERSGGINLGVDGIMVAGAFAAVVAGALGGWGVSLAGGAFIGALFGAGVAIAVLKGGADEIIAGIALSVLGVGLASFFFKIWQPSGRSVMVVPLVPVVDIPWLRELPLVGEALFGQSLLTYLCIGLAVVIAWMLRATRIGLAIRATGDDPAAAALRGVDVRRVRAGAFIVGGALAGLGGAAISVGYLGSFTDGVTAGRGFVAIAVVIIGRWSPSGVLAGSLLFAFFDALSLRAQSGATSVPVEAFSAMPYAVTLVALFFIAQHRRAPRALGRPLPGD